MFNFIVKSNGTVELYNDALGMGVYTDSSTSDRFGNTTLYWRSNLAAIGCDNKGPWFKLKVGKLRVDYNC